MTRKRHDRIDLYRDCTVRRLRCESFPHLATNSGVSFSNASTLFLWIAARFDTGWQKAQGNWRKRNSHVQLCVANEARLKRVRFETSWIYISATGHLSKAWLLPSNKCPLKSIVNGSRGERHTGGQNYKIPCKITGTKIKQIVVMRCYYLILF